MLSHYSLPTSRIFVVLLVGLALANCGTSAERAAVPLSKPAVSQETQQARPGFPSVVASTDQQHPSAPLCGIGEGEIASITINMDTPVPRCIRVTATQRLQVINRTSTQVALKLAHFDVRIVADASHLFDAPVGTYLAPGVHRLTVSGYPGSGGAEIWVVDES